MEYDWDSFKTRISIKASIPEIYAKWATKEGLESWFLRKAVFTEENGQPLFDGVSVQKGNRYTWYWHGWDDETKEEGTILYANGWDTLQFTFGEHGAKGMFCTVSIYEEEGENICSLVQENIPTDEKGKTQFHIGCLTGWNFYLANMKSIMEGGVDLRNKNIALRNVLNA